MDRKALLREAAEDSLLLEGERRRFIYADVEQLIDPGFLSHTVLIGECSLTLRSLPTTSLHALFPRIEHSVGSDWKRWFIAHSLWIAGGYVIEEEPNSPYHVFQNIRNLRIEFVDVLVSCCIGLRNRVERATLLSRGYCQEEYSRGNWRLSGAPPGPLNFLQKIWVAHNKAADRHDHQLGEWAHTRAIAGSMSGKAAKAIQKSMDSWTTRHQDFSQRAIEDTVNWVIQGNKAEQQPLTVTVDGKTYEVPTVHSAQTVEDLQAEMDRAMRGEKDYHDIIVDQYKAAHRARLLKAREEQQKAWAESTEAGGEVGVTGTSQLVGYTPDQLAEINPAILQHKPRTRQEGTDPSREAFDRYITSNEQVGWIGTGGMPEAANPPPTTKKPSPSDGGSLQERISRRNPRLKS